MGPQRARGRAVGGGACTGGGGCLPDAHRALRDRGDGQRQWGRRRERRWQRRPAGHGEWRHHRSAPWRIERFVAA